MRSIILLAGLMAMASAAAAQLRIIDSLENQSIGHHSYCRSTNTLTFSPGVNSQNTVGVWFSFGISGFRTDTVLTVVESAAEPVHLCRYPAISPNNKDFERIAASRKGSQSCWRISPKSDTIYMATGLPYTYSMLCSYLGSKAGCKSISVENLLATSQGRSVKLVTVGSQGKAKKPKRLVWIICRQHAFESLSNYVLEGMIDYLASVKCSRRIRNRLIFKIVPMVDVESVWSGQSGRMSLPRDFNRDWDNPVRPAIRIIESKIKESAREHIYHTFWDLHTTYPGGYIGMVSYYNIFGSTPRKKPILKYWERFKNMQGWSPYEFSDDSASYIGVPADVWNARSFGTLGISSTLEIDWSLTTGGKPWSASQYRSLGAAMIKAMGR